MLKVDETIRKSLENERRSKLQKEKPYVYEKIMRFAEKEQRGESTCMIDFCYDYICNMHCAHCANARFEVRNRELTLDDIANLSRQADELGLAQFNISGGEPLLFPELDDIIRTLDPEKFHISLATNGLLLTYEKALHLKQIGLDKIKVSLDSIDENMYEKTRQQKGAYAKALKAIDNAREAGLQVTIQAVVSHQNCISQETERLARFAHERGINLDVMTAKAIGRWEGKEEILLTPEDNEYLIQLRNRYPEVQRDIFPTYGKRGGCNAVKRTLYLLKHGDVLPCGFIQISIGNIFEEPLRDIINRGLRIK